MHGFPRVKVCIHATLSPSRRTIAPRRHCHTSRCKPAGPTVTATLHVIHHPSGPSYKFSVVWASLPSRAFSVSIRRARAVARASLLLAHAPDSDSAVDLDSGQPPVPSHPQAKLHQLSELISSQM
eukprot:1093752-Rhodomonas_salina.1